MWDAAPAETAAEDAGKAEGEMDEDSGFVRDISGKCFQLVSEPGSRSRPPGDDHLDGARNADGSIRTGVELTRAESHGVRRRQRRKRSFIEAVPAYMAPT